MNENLDPKSIFQPGRGGPDGRPYPPSLFCTPEECAGARQMKNFSVPGREMTWFPTRVLVLCKASPSTPLPSKVYPWIAQIGQNKAGFYSYEILENIVGCQMHNTYRLVPEWQKLEVGSQLQMHPMGGIPITAVYPEQGYLTGGMLDADKGASLEPGAPLPEHIITISWLFYVYDISNGDSRFISRWRVKYPPSFKNELIFGRYLLEPIAHVMDVKMLKTIRNCAEGK